MGLKLLKLSAEWCGICAGMNRARTCEKFVESHPDVVLETHHTVDEGDAADLKQDTYGVRGLPAFVWEDDEGNVVHQHEGGTNLAGLEKHYQKALGKLESGDYGAEKKRRGKKS